MELLLKKVDIDDVEILKSISIKTFVDAFGHQNTQDDMDIYLGQSMTIPRLTSELNNPNSSFYFAYAGDQLAGYIKVNVNDTQSEKIFDNSLEIERIYVLQDFQGRKIGAFLLNEALSMAQKWNKTIVWLGVWEKNNNAIQFYQHAGFETFGSHEFMLGNDLQTDILMQKIL